MNWVRVIGLDATDPDFPVLRFAAMLRAARDLGLDQAAVNAIALRFDPGRPDLAQVAEALSDALLADHPLELPDAA
jgi:hypothetical protein